MWIRLVFAKADPAKVAEVRNLYTSQELTDFFEAQPGHRFHHLLESPTEAGDIVFSDRLGQPGADGGCL